MCTHQRHHQNTPCLNCQPQNFIRMVQNLIEKCLQFHMSRDDCIATLVKHANIEPVVTQTVWEELSKENRSFFQAYLHDNNNPMHCIDGVALNCEEEKRHGGSGSGSGGAEFNQEGRRHQF